MKATGIVRKIDELGRIVLPKSTRRTLEIEDGDSLEIYVDGIDIVLRKYERADIFTGEMEDLIEYKGKKVSLNSIREMVKLADLSFENFRLALDE